MCGRYTLRTSLNRLLQVCATEWEPVTQKQTNGERCRACVVAATPRHFQGNHLVTIENGGRAPPIS